MKTLNRNNELGERAKVHRGHYHHVEVEQSKLLYRYLIALGGVKIALSETKVMSCPEGPFQKATCAPFLKTSTVLPYMHCRAIDVEDLLMIETSSYRLNSHCRQCTTLRLVLSVMCNGKVLQNCFPW